MNRRDVISRLADMIADIRLGHPVRVGIDGVDAAGKTVLSNELAGLVRVRGRHVIRASVDGFHNPAEERYRQGRSSPRGYYEDSFNHNAILSCILLPLGSGGDLRYKPVCFDYRTNSVVHAEWEEAQPDSILLFEGVFLYRPELQTYWDFTIFVEAGFDVTVQRACRRSPSESPEAIHESYRRRYIPGQKLYLETAYPSEKANVILDNNDIQNPKLRINRPANHAIEAISHG